MQDCPIHKYERFHPLPVPALAVAHCCKLLHDHLQSLQVKINHLILQRFGILQLFRSNVVGISSIIPNSISCFNPNGWIILCISTGASLAARGSPRAKRTWQSVRAAEVRALASGDRVKLEKKFPEFKNSV